MYYSKPICPSSQMQLRDYPEPLLAMTEVTISGRILFAEQEAQERGSYNVASLNGRTHSTDAF